jgi:hypothetical protein
VDSTKAKMGESLEKELKNGCCWQKMKAAENNLQKNRLSIGSLFLSKIYLSFLLLQLYL